MSLSPLSILFEGDYIRDIKWCMISCFCQSTEYICRLKMHKPTEVRGLVSGRNISLKAEMTENIFINSYNNISPTETETFQTGRVPIKSAV